MPEEQWLEDSEYINPDNVARDVFGDWNNQESVLKAANYCNEWREKCLAEHKSHIFETVMSAVDKLGFDYPSGMGNGKVTMAGQDIKKLRIFHPALQ